MQNPDSQDVVLSETLVVLRWSVVFDLLFLLLCLWQGWLTPPMVVGLLLGTGYAVLNFMLLGRGVEAAVQMAPHRAQRYMALQYILRMGLTAAVIIIAIKADFINPWGVMVPLIYPRLALLIHYIFRKEAKK